MFWIVFWLVLSTLGTLMANWNRPLPSIWHLVGGLVAVWATAYFGFCLGAWAVKSDLVEAKPSAAPMLEMIDVPDGHYEVEL